MYVSGNKKQTKRVHINPVNGKPQKFKSKECKFCKLPFTPDSPCHLYCSQDCADNGWSEGYVKRQYGMSFDDWVCAYEEAEGRCQICGDRGFKLNKNSLLLLVIDHDHSTGEVRGLLCHNCNRALGLLKDDTNRLSQAIKYLEGSTTIP